MKPNFRYQIDFRGWAAKWSIICMAASFFATLVAYFGLSNMVDCSFGEVLFLMILPAFLSVGYVFFMKFKQLNAPGIYGLLGAGLCFAILIGCFLSGNVVRILLGLVWYIASSLALLAYVGGYVGGQSLVAGIFGIAIVFRLLFFTAGITSPLQLCKDIAGTLALSSLMLLPLSMKTGKTCK